jgi:hypothetical protein
MKPLIILQQVLHKISNMSGMRQLNQLFTQLAWKTLLFLQVGSRRARTQRKKIIKYRGCDFHCFFSLISLYILMSSETKFEILMSN